MRRRGHGIVPPHLWTFDPADWPNDCATATERFRTAARAWDAARKAWAEAHGYWSLGWDEQRCRVAEAGGFLQPIDWDAI